MSQAGIEPNGLVGQPRPHMYSPELSLFQHKYAPGEPEADRHYRNLDERFGRLRTRGGVSESRVPFVLNRPLRAEYAARAAAGGLRSRQIFDVAINGVD